MLTVTTTPLSSIIELTGTPFSVEYYTSTPASLSLMPSSDSGPIFSTVADLSTEESTISGNSQVAGPNLGICVAIPVVIFFVVGLMLVVSLIVIIYYARKSKNCKTVNIILTNKIDSNYTHIPLVGADGESEDF